MKFVDLLKFTATGASAATITASGAVSGFRTLAQAIADGRLAVGDTGVPFAIDDGTGKRETSLFTVTSSTVLTRTSVLSSTAGGTASEAFTGNSLSVASAMPASFASRIVAAAVDASGNFVSLLDPKGNVIPLGSGSSGGSIVVPSGDATGATDVATINNMLNLNGRVTLQPGGQYYYNAPITMPSRSHLTAYGSRNKLVAGSFGNIIRNKAVLADRSATDGSFINPNNNSIVTSLTANFVAGDVGNMLSVFGATPGGAAWYGPIVAVTTPANATAWAASTAKIAGNLGRPSTANGNLYQVTTAGTTGTTQPTWPTSTGNTVTDGTVVWTCLGAATGATLNRPGLVAVTNAPISIFYASSRNEDITISGGYWEITENLGGGHVGSSTFQNSFASAFRRVSNLRIKDTTWQTYGPVNAGGRFTMSIADFSNVNVDGTNFIETSGDGVHLTGPGDSAVVTNTRGTTGDDMVVANCGDSNTPYITDTEGSLTNLTFRDGVAKLVGSRGFNLYDTSSPARWQISNVLLENWSGVSFNDLVRISCAVFGLVIRKVSGAPNQANIPLVNFTSSPGAGSGAVIEDVTWTSSLPAASGIIRIADPRGPFHIKNVRFGSNPVGTNIGVYLNGSLNGSGFGIPILSYDGYYSGNASSATYAPSPVDSTALYVGFTTASSGSTTINMRNIFNYSDTGYVINKTFPGQINRINLSDSQVGGMTLAAFPSGDSPITVALHNVKTFGPLVKTSSSLTLELSNVDISTSAALVQLTGTGASASIRMANTAGGTTLVSRDGTQSVRVRGSDIPVDQAILTPQDGDQVYNNNAAQGNGAGVALYNTAAAKWKNLYSGVTN